MKTAIDLQKKSRKIKRNEQTSQWTNKQTFVITTPL